MVSEPILCRRCARSAASATGCWGASLRTTAWSARRRWLGETARDVAKGLPIRLLHGGSHAAWLAAHGLMEEHPVLPLMARLEKVPARHAICLGARPQSTTTTPRHHLARTHTKAQPSRLRMKVQPETCSLIYHTGMVRPRGDERERGGGRRSSSQAVAQLPKEDRIFRG